MRAGRKDLVEAAERRGREWAEREVGRLVGPPSTWPREWACAQWLAVDQIHDLAAGGASGATLAAVAEQAAARRYGELRTAASMVEPAGGDADQRAVVREILAAVTDGKLAELQRHQLRHHLLPWEGTPLWTDDARARGALWAAADQSFVARAILCDWQRHHACRAVDGDGREYVASYFEHFDADAAVDPVDRPPTRVGALALADARGEGWADWAFFRLCERDDPRACGGRWPPQPSTAGSLVEDLEPFATPSSLVHAALAAADRRWSEIESDADELAPVDLLAIPAVRH